MAVYADPRLFFQIELGGPQFVNYRPGIVQGVDNSSIIGILCPWRSKFTVGDFRLALVTLQWPPQEAMQADSHHGDDALSLAPSAREDLVKLARNAALSTGRSTRPMEAEFSAGSRVAEPSLDKKLPPSRLVDGRPTREGPSFGRRALRRVSRFLLTACIGVAATLAWQSHGDAARQIVADWAAQRGWSSWLSLVGLPSDRDVPRRQMTTPAPVQVPIAEPTQPETIAAAPPSAPQLEAMAQDSVAIRQKLEQLVAGQEQLAQDMAKLQNAVQEIEEKALVPAPRPNAAQAIPPGTRRSAVPVRPTTSEPPRTLVPVR